MNKNVNNKERIDLMHYKNNKISFWLILFTIALNVAMFLIIYTTTGCTASVQLGIDLMVNIIFLLLCFLAAEKTKRYSRDWGITSIVLGGLEILRICWIPLYYFLAYKKSGTGLDTAKFISCLLLLLFAGICLIIAGITTIKKAKILKNNKPLIEVEGEKKDVRT